ncbi:hypothetical protein G3A39_41395 [Paraburkholderia aspalathi]|nr:hypothetical protein [Paraburkholderia aspalathi]
MLAPVLRTAPAELPVTLEEARKHLDVYGFDDDDNQIKTLIRAATTHLEKTLDMALVTQVWSQSFCGFSMSMRLPKRPVKSIINVTYYDVDNQTQTLPDTAYILLVYSCGSVLQVVPGQSLPATAIRPDAIAVEYEAGVPVADVDASLKAAILLHVGSLYEHRDDLSAVKPESTGAYEMLIWPYRRPKV